MNSLVDTSIVLCFLTALCVRGCRETVGEFNRSERPRQHQSLAGGRHDLAIGIVAMAHPSREGLRICYQGTGMTYNMRGDNLLAPLDLKDWREFSLENNRRALAILDDMTNTSLVFMYEAFTEGERTFEISNKNLLPTAWLLRHPIADGKDAVHAAWTAFLREPSTSATTFKLEGDCKLIMHEGLISEIVCEELQTMFTVSPDRLWLKKHKEWAERNLVNEEARLDKDPESIIYKASVERARSRLEAICSMLDSPQLLPAKYINVHCKVTWVREKPLFEIELL